MQTWPEFLNFHGAIFLRTLSTSTSSQIITGAWPPNSKVHFFNVFEDNDWRCFPTSTEPVKVTAFGIGDSSK